MKQILFAGGIHGVGKSTLCREIAAQFSLNYLSASEVLRWKDLNTDEKNKKVVDIPDTQSRLLRGLEAIVKPGQRYVLDGHFCLFNKEGEVTSVPMETFERIKPFALILVTGDPAQISSALARRDDKSYDAEVLEEMQNHEMSHAQQVAAHLNVALIHFDKTTTQLPDLYSQLHESLT